MSDRVKFLLVDDLEDNLHALEALLRREELEILTARSGREALELLLVHDVALAILDVHMPEMDGFELAELMRGTERTRQVPIIFVTAGARSQHRMFKGYESGAVDFLYKPVEPTILQQKAEIFFQLFQQKRQLAEQLQKLQESAIERERLVNDLTETLRLAEMFTAVLGHDLRNPLSVIITSAELLLRRAEEETMRKPAARILSSGRRMTRMIGELLDLSRARLAGGIPLEFEHLDLLALCKKVIGEHEVMHPDRHVVLDHQGNAQGIWDEDRLFQVLSNLVGNAIRHGRPDAPVHLRLDARRNDAVTLEVQNAGAIPSKLLPHLFDPFRSGHRKRERPSDGLGLGLYIVREIARAHGGTVTVESTESAGTTFRIELPRSRHLPAQASYAAHS